MIDIITRHNRTTSLGDRPTGRGFIGLVTVIMIGALVLAIGLTAVFIGQTQIIISGQIDRAQVARQTVAACVDEALYRLKKDETYAGGTVNVGTLSCALAVTGSGASRTITASAAFGDITQAVTVSAALKQNGAGNARGWSVQSWTEANP